MSNAHALSSNGSDGAFVVNGEVTLNVLDGQVFNFTTIDINSDGVLSLFGATPNSSFSMLASGDINIAGLLNIFTNTIFETAGNINITGTMAVKNQSSVSLLGNAIVSGSLLLEGSAPNISNPAIIPSIGGCLVVSGFTCDKIPAGYIVGENGNLIINSGGTISLIADPVPEPSSYALLLSGIALISMARRKTSI